MFGFYYGLAGFRGFVCEFEVKILLVYCRWDQQSCFNSLLEPFWRIIVRRAYGIYRLAFIASINSIISCFCYSFLYSCLNQVVSLGRYAQTAISLSFPKPCVAYRHFDNRLHIYFSFSLLGSLLNTKSYDSFIHS